MKKALAALAVAVLVLAGVFKVGTWMREQAVAPRSPYADMAPGDVVRLHVVYLGDSVTLIRPEGHWVTARDRFPADTARLRRVLGHLLGLQRKEEVSRAFSGEPADMNLAAYDLDDAAARRVTWTMSDGRTVTVLLGKVSGIDYGSSFWKPADSAVVYRTPRPFVFDVSSRSQDWKDTTLFTPFEPGDIQAVSVDWRDDRGLPVRYTLERDTSREEAAGSGGSQRTEGYVLVGGDGARSPARREEAARVFDQAARFKVDEFVGGVDTAATEARRASLDEPFMVIRITLRDGTRHAVVAGDVVHDLYRYVRHPRHPDPVRVFVWRFADFRKTVGGLRE